MFRRKCIRLFVFGHLTLNRLPTMLKKILFAFLTVALVLAVLGGVKAIQIKALIAAGANPPQQSESVSTVIAQEEIWRSTIASVGSLKSVQGVALSTEVPGTVSKILFESGQEVEAGQALVELDASTEQAQLQAAKASLSLAKLKRDRSRELREKNTIAQADVDSSEAEFLQAEAQVKNIEAVLAKKRITAPFSGRLGIRNVNLGQFLNAGADIVSLQSLDPIFLDFTLPQQRLGIVSTGMTVEARLDAYPERVFTGELTAITPEVDQSTRAGNLRASFANADGALRPGMFANVAVVRPEEKSVLVVPATAILYAPYGDSVYLLQDGESGGKVAFQKFVRVLERRGDFVAIEAGLKAGDEIVATGVFKLRNGMAVNVNNDLLPDAQLNPEPEDA